MTALPMEVENTLHCSMVEFDFFISDVTDVTDVTPLILLRFFGAITVPSVTSMMHTCWTHQ
jgi:hypothetical protein